MQRHLPRSFAARSGPGLLLGAVLLAVAACATKKTATVSGKVICQGQPVPMGAIYFHGGNDQMAMGILQNDGSFTATDVPLGEIKATVQARDPGVYAQQMRGPAGVAPQPAPAAFVAVPAKYADVNTTDLVFTIAGDTKDLEVNLR
jgi:hypothetical protein